MAPSLVGLLTKGSKCKAAIVTAATKKLHSGMKIFNKKYRRLCGLSTYFTFKETILLNNRLQVDDAATLQWLLLFQSTGSKAQKFQ